MFTYSDTDPSCIISCDLSNVNTEKGEICAEALFPIGSTCKDMHLLLDTIKICSTHTRWKCCLEKLHKIRCSCCKASNFNRNMPEGSIRKSCTWTINMKSSKYSDAIRGHPHK